MAKGLSYLLPIFFFLASKRRINMSFLFLSPVIFEMIWNIAGVAQGKEKEPRRFHYILNDSRCMLEICHCQLQIRYQKLFACVVYMLSQLSLIFWKPIQAVGYKTKFSVSSQPKIKIRSISLSKFFWLHPLYLVKWFG